MNRTQSLLVSLTAVLVCGSATLAQTKPSTVVGTLKLHTLKFGDKDRTIRVWLPAGYDPAGDHRYPVVYMHDGQNLFDNATSGFGEWKIDETITDLAKREQVDAPIVVGIDNGGNDRIAELTFTKNGEQGGNGAAYEAFVMNVVLPFVEAQYRVRTDREHTVIGGSSLGGTVSIGIAQHHPEKFGKVLAMSPSIWWDRGAVLRELMGQPDAFAKTTVYLDMGEHEGPEGPDRAKLVQLARMFDAVLTNANVEHRLVIDPIGEHNEGSWSRRFPAAIEYLLPPPVLSPTTGPATEVPATRLPAARG